MKKKVSLGQERGPPYNVEYIRCTKCDKRFKTDKRLFEHRKVCEPELDLRAQANLRCQCPYCPKEFKDANRRYMHIDFIHIRNVKRFPTMTRSEITPDDENVVITNGQSN